MHFLVVDVRFGSPVHVFLEHDPRGQEGYPALAVREVTLEPGAGTTIGRDPVYLARFRQFPSDAAVARAGFVLIEPRYVGPDWEGYSHHFRPEGEKPSRRP